MDARGLRIDVPFIDFLAEEGLQHGTRAAWRWGCRCDKCKPMKEGKRNDPSFMQKRNGRNFHPNAPHGTENGYNNYRCRCDECTAANTLKTARKRFGYDPSA